MSHSINETQVKISISKLVQSLALSIRATKRPPIISLPLKCTRQLKTCIVVRWLYSIQTHITTNQKTNLNEMASLYIEQNKMGKFSWNRENCLTHFTMRNLIFAANNTPQMHHHQHHHHSFRCHRIEITYNGCHKWNKLYRSCSSNAIYPFISVGLNEFYHTDIHRTKGCFIYRECSTTVRIAVEQNKRKFSIQNFSSVLLTWRFSIEKSKKITRITKTSFITPTKCPAYRSWNKIPFQRFVEHSWSANNMNLRAKQNYSRPHFVIYFSVMRFIFWNYILYFKL
jgi:hypothetical protein